MHGRTVFVCGLLQCGRVIYPSDEQVKDWLIGERVDDPAVLVVRCPQHITERTMKDVGLPRSKANYRWVREVRERDAKLMERGRAPIPMPGHIVPLTPEMIAAIMTQNEDTSTMRKDALANRKKRRRK